MAIINYNEKRPQSQIIQNKEVVLDAPVSRSNAVLFGPGYKQFVNDKVDVKINASKHPYFKISSSDVSGLDLGKLNGTTLIFKNLIKVEGSSEGGYKQAVQDDISRNGIGPTPESDIGVGFNAETSEITFNKIYALSKEELEAFIAGLNNESIVPEESKEVFNELKTALITNGYFCAVEGDLAISYIAKLPLSFEADTKIVSIYNTQNIIDNFGPIEPENPLAYACSVCLSAGEGKLFYATPVDSTIDENGKCVAAVEKSGEKVTRSEADIYQEVLTKLSANSNLQFLCPLTTDHAVHEACSTHCMNVSDKLTQRWRRVYCTLLDDEADKNTKIDNLIAAAKDLSSDRAICIWCDSPKQIVTNDEGKLEETELDPIYVTAGIVGIRAAALPQQGLSMQELGFVSSAPLMYTKYDNADLNKIASYGILIVTQDGDEEDVYIRHQLTTETDKGVMYYEDSVGVNIDNISYQVKDIIRGYVGKRNITPATLVEIKNRYYGLLAGLTVAPLGQIIGPQINKIVEGSVKVSIDPYMKDRVILQATVEIPLPLNSLIVYLNSVVTNSI